MRYRNQELIIGNEGQGLLRRSAVAIIGIGALGTVAAELLARAGIGKLILIDKDIVDISNLQRQSLFDESDIGKPKVDVAREKIGKINSDIFIDAKATNLNSGNINEINADVLIDCADNIETKLLLNEYAIKKGIPLVHGAVAGSRGQLFNVVPGSTCLRCIFKESELECENEGILNSVSHLIGAMQANEALKILLKKNYEKCLIRIDVFSNNFEKINVKKNNKCAACNGNYEYLNKTENKKTKPFIIEKCKTKAVFAAKPVGNVKLNLGKIKKVFKTKMETPIILVLDCEDEIIVHDYGEIIFKTLTDTKKIEKIANEIYEAGSYGRRKEVVAHERSEYT